MWSAFERRRCDEACQQQQPKSCFQEALSSTPLKHNVNIDKTKLSERRAGHSHHSDIALVLVRYYALHQLVMKGPGSGMEQIFYFLDQKNGTPDFLASVALRLKVMSG